MRRSVQQLAVVALAISVFTAMSVAPVAATGGLDIGDDDSISIGTDGVSVGGDEGIDINTSSGDGVEVEAGGDSGVEVGAGTDGVEVGAGGESGVQVGADTEDGVDADAAGTDVAEVGTDGSASVAGQEVGADSVENLPAGDTSGVESLPLQDTSGLESVTGGGAGDVAPGVDGLTQGDYGVESVSEQLPGSGDLLGSGDVPGAGDLPGSENLPGSDTVGPEDFPIGGENATVNACDTLDVDSDDVPADSLPGLNDLPSEAVPSGVPTDLLTTQAILGILLGVTPGPCEVYHPNDPPYAPVTGDDEIDPAYDEEIQYIGENDGGFLGVVLYDATLNESGNGPGISTVTAIGANPQYGDIDLRYAVQDGEKEYAVDPRLRYNQDRVWGNLKLVLLGKNIGAGAECDRPEQYGGDLGDLQEDPLGPCEYKVIGLMNPPIGPAEAIDIVLGSVGSVGEEPLLPGESLPVNPDDLLSA
jgi:hypothetical protein